MQGISGAGNVLGNLMNPAASTAVPEIVADTMANIIYQPSTGPNDTSSIFGIPTESLDAKKRDEGIKAAENIQAYITAGGLGCVR